LIRKDALSYRYDAENQRIALWDTQLVVSSQSALSQVLVRTRGNGQVTYYVYGLGLIGEASAGNYFSYHFDFRGSTVALTDDNGAVKERVFYSPFGVILDKGEVDTPFLFNGLYGVMTDSNNLYYMRARYYSPEIRRFVNQDVVLGNVTRGQSLNRFAFVEGNPVSFVDPFGLELVIVNDVEGLDIKLSEIIEMAKTQIYCNEKLSNFFNSYLSKVGLTISDVLDGDIDVPVGVYEGDWTDANAYTKWRWVFSNIGFSGQPDRSIGIDDSFFKVLLWVDEGTKQRTAGILIHELAHWIVEGYVYNSSWTRLGREIPGGYYDFGEYVAQELVDWSVKIDDECECECP